MITLSLHYRQGSLQPEVTPNSGEAVRRRKLIGGMLLKGLSPTVIAKEVGVSRQTVYDVRKKKDVEGVASLGTRKAPGIKPYLDLQMLSQLQDDLLLRPTKHGFTGSRWSGKRVQSLIERKWGIEVSIATALRILRKSFQNE